MLAPQISTTAMQSAQPAPTPPISANSYSTAPAARSGAEAELCGGPNRLVESRLGGYSGLFYALRAKHPPSAMHGLRVAVGCSKWSSWRKLDDRRCERLEVAALLHDVGKIGIPDRVLQKPAKLDNQEQALMEMHVALAAEMLRGAGAEQALIDIIEHAHVSFEMGGEQLTAEARMLAIVDAFDSMTSEQIFRKALSRERAIDELFRHAGTQFDAELVHDFADLISQPRPELEAAMAGRWVAHFAPKTVAGFSTADFPVSCGAIQNLVDTVYHRRLLDTLTDAAVYVDATGQILTWNRAAEQLTGRQACALMHCTWTTEIMGLRGRDNEEILESDCPLRSSFRSHVCVNSRLSLTHVDGRNIQVNFTAAPVFSARGEALGAILLIKDASAQARLEERVESLNTLASQDALTKVANRVALDQRLPKFLKEHLEHGRRGSLIICDIDHFKRINDTYGHQAGDEALVVFASVLREFCREGDLVARYGGEEFVVLCDGCDNPAATARAEELRRAVERTPLPVLGGNTMTASFGVTESQPGDSPATLIARADRALLSAKESGRNRVVQLGAGHDPEQTIESPVEALPQERASWWDWFRSGQEVAVLSTERLASVPHTIAVQKLEGFISDHGAQVLQTEAGLITLKIDGTRGTASRRRGERSAVMIMDIQIKPVDYRHPRTNCYQAKTKLCVTIRAVKPRDRRSDALIGQAHQLLASFNSYLMTQEIIDEMRDCIAEHR